LLGVICSGGCLCYSGPCSSSLAIVCVSGVVKVLRVFGGSWPVELSLFLLIGLLFAPLLIMSFVILFVCWFPVSRLLLLRDWESLSSCNLV